MDFTIYSGLRFLAMVATAGRASRQRVSIAGPLGPRSGASAEASGSHCDAFYVRMVHWAAPDAWDIAVKVDDAAALDDTRESAFGLWMVQIHFPCSDIPEITQRLAAYRAGQRVRPAPIDWTSVELPAGSL